MGEISSFPRLLEHVDEKKQQTTSCKVRANDTGSCPSRSQTPSPVPVLAAFWLCGPGLLGLHCFNLDNLHHFLPRIAMINSDDDNEIDFKVHDGYVAFSREIVRLALLSPLVFTFFITLAGKDADIHSLRQLIQPSLHYLFASFLFMALAVFFGLFHRYCAIDFMATLVERRRKGGSMSGDWRVGAASASIWVAPFCLFFGASLLFITVFKVLEGDERCTHSVAALSCGQMKGSLGDCLAKSAEHQFT